MPRNVTGAAEFGQTAAAWWTPGLTCDRTATALRPPAAAAAAAVGHGQPPAYRAGTSSGCGRHDPAGRAAASATEGRPSDAPAMPPLFLWPPAEVRSSGHPTRTAPAPVALRRRPLRSARRPSPPPARPACRPRSRPWRSPRRTPCGSRAEQGTLVTSLHAGYVDTDLTARISAARARPRGGGARRRGGRRGRAAGPARRRPRQAARGRPRSRPDGAVPAARGELNGSRELSPGRPPAAAARSR